MPNTYRKVNKKYILNRGYLEALRDEAVFRKNTLINAWSKWKLRPKSLGVGCYQDILLLVGEGKEDRNDERDAMGRWWDRVLQEKGFEISWREKGIGEAEKDL